MSDAYKEYYDVGNESNGIFRFGISWVLAEEKKNREMKGHQGNVAKGIEIISINVRGIGESDKKGWIKSIIMIEQPDVIGMQETKSGSVDDYWINNWWGGKDYGYAQLPAIGNSGGIILVWDLRVFICKEAVGNERFVAVRGSWKGKWMKDEVVSFVDLNVVRGNDDRLNSQMNSVFEAADEYRLVEIPMRGENSLELVMRALNLAKPFRVFNVWLDEPDFYHVVKEAWKKEVRSFRSDCVFRDRMKNVKVSLRAWSKERFSGTKETIGTLKNEAMRWELEARNNKCNIRGLMVDGVWCEDPKVIKAEMARHYKRLFFEGKVIHLVFCSNRIEKISRDDATLLEKAFEEKEKKKLKILIFKVDFEKAYDNINWRFLIDIMKKMGFGDKWCKWVDSCLRSSSMSILVNGSPSDEFGLERGIRQGVKVGTNNVTVSHLQYADDNIFFGEWSKENTKALMCVLKCFEEVSGLRVITTKGLLEGEVWGDILKIGKEVDGIGVEFTSSCIGVLGDERNIRRKEASMSDREGWVDNRWVWEWCGN
ncbi:RNA-directed DNA polymerase, eukaryota [Tanacetum coccineum]